MSNNKIKPIKTIVIFIVLPIILFVGGFFIFLITFFQIHPFVYLSTALAVIINIFTVIKSNKSRFPKRIIIPAEIGFLSPMIGLLLLILGFIIMPVFTSNAWCLLACSGYEIPKESSIFTFRETQDNNEGSGEYWLYGEDDENYYANFSYPESDADYTVLKKGTEPAGFNKLDIDTWGVRKEKEE
jgi:hypothetical protein